MLSSGVVSEIFIFSIMKKLLFNFSLKHLFWFSTSMTIIRWLIFAQFAEYSIMLWLGIILHGLSFAATHALSMQWISKEISDNNQSMVQALYSGLGFGGGVALGTGVAGFLWNDGTNSSGAFYFAAFCVFIAFILSLYIFDSQKENLTVESYPELAENN
jgi:PPP family 3-phenylpropionic acid transporter